MEYPIRLNSKYWIMGPLVDDEIHNVMEKELRYHPAGHLPEYVYHAAILTIDRLHIGLTGGFND